VAHFPPCDDVCGALEEHVRLFFHDRDIDVWTWPAGPISQENPHFRVLRVAPVQVDGVWTYLSTGGWAATADSGQAWSSLCARLSQPSGRSSCSQ